MSEINIDSAVAEIVGDPTPRKRGRPPKEGGGTGMVMSPGEIVREYNAAKNPAAQITILAEQNGVSEGDIKRLLVDNGVDYRRLPRKSQKPPMPKKVVAPAVISCLEKEQLLLSSRSEEIARLIPALQAELKQIDLKLDALQRARGIIAEIYGGTCETD